MGAEDVRNHADTGGLPVGAGNMNHRIGAVRVSHQPEQMLDALEPRSDSLADASIEKGHRRLVVTRIVSVHGALS